MSQTLYYQDNEENRRVLAACPTLSAGFVPPPWMRNTHVQLNLWLKQEEQAPSQRWDRIERLVMEDGGLVSLQWAGINEPEDTPIVLLLPTIMGDGDTLRALVAYLRAALGWVVVVCNRRGHAGLPLTTPRFNTMGDMADLRAQVAHIQELRPHAALYGVGISAGSGLLARYLGETPDTPLRAGAMHSPGYDLADLFDHTHPIYSRVMAKRLKRHFLEQNAALFADHPDYATCMAAVDLGEFHRCVHRLSGFATRAAYLAVTNPMVVAHDIRVPLLAINAEDDPICHVRVVEREGVTLIDSLRNGILVLTRYGSHCAHIHGLRRRPTWAYQVLAEFLAAHA